MSDKMKVPKIVHGVPTVGLAALGIVLVWVTFTYFIELSSFAMIVAKATVGLFLAGIVDNFLLRHFRTHDEISGGNVAYALVYFGYMAIIGAAIVSS